LVDRVLVTGGACFIGSHLVDKLIDEGFEVVVLDDFSSGRRENLNQHFGKANFCLVEGDVRSRADVEKTLKGVDVVFHLAAIVSVGFSVKNPLLVNEVNVSGTLNILWESLNAGAKRFVYAEPRADDIRRSCADLSKAERMLGYKPKTSLRDGLSVLLMGAG